MSKPYVWKDKKVAELEEENQKLKEKPSDLKTINPDGIIIFEKSREEKNKQAIFIGIVGLVILFALLITDLINYC